MSASRKFMDALRTTGRPPGGDFVKNSGDMGPLARMYTEAGRYLRRRQDRGITDPLNSEEVAILHGALEREASEGPGTEKQEHRLPGHRHKRKSLGWGSWARCGGSW